jgi:hypothetical protein
MRDNFSLDLKETLAKRTGYRCSNPACRQLTTGPHDEPSKSINIGVAAHITAASIRGPRYDVRLSSTERKAIRNGIWLCQKCAKLIDSDVSKYDKDVLFEWKKIAELSAINEIEGRINLSKNQIISSDELYTKRLSSYQKLYSATQKAASIVGELFDLEEISLEEANEIVSSIVFEICRVTDEDTFYLDHETNVHTIGAFIGVADDLTIENADEKLKAKNNFYQQIRIVYRRIESFRDNGMIDTSIVSPIIIYFRQTKKQKDIEDQKFSES